MKLNPILLLPVLPSLSYAQTPQGKVEFSQGPVVSSGRVIGLGGAYIGIAEGGDVPLLNPVAFVVRYPHRQDSWFDWDFGLSWLNSIPNDGIDVDQSGQAAIDAISFLEIGVSAKFGRHGFGIHSAFQQYDFSAVTNRGAEQLAYVQAQLGPGYAYSSPRGLTVGAMILGGRLALSSITTGEPLSFHQGAGLLMGMLYAPCEAQYRVGATARSAIESLPVFSQAALERGLPVPEEFFVPRELGVGVSRYWGERKYNPCIPKWELGAHKDEKHPQPPTPIFVTAQTQPETAPASQSDTEPASLPEVKLDFYKPLSRKYYLLSVDLVLTGASFAQGMQAFIAGLNQPAGEAPTLSLRAGVEAEPLENKLKVRGGSYYEPSRFEAFSGRLHLTTNVEYHLLSFARREWKVSLTADLARQYQNAGIGIGFWH